MVEKNEDYKDIDQYSSAIAHYTLKTVSKVIKEWYIYTVKKRILMELERYMKNKRRSKIIRTLIREWFELSMNEKLNKARTEYFTNKKSKIIQLECFKYWYYQHYLIRRETFRIYIHIKRVVEFKLTKQVLYFWYKELEYNRKYCNFNKKRLLKNAFRRWQIEYIRLNELLIELIRLKKKRIFLLFYDYCINKHKKEKMLIQKLRFIEVKRLSMFFNQWIALVQYSMNKRYKILEWQIQIKNNKMIGILYYWRYFVRKKRTDINKGNIIKLKFETKIKYSIFNYWLDLTHENYREKTLMIISGLTARRHLLLKGFNSLKIYIFNKRESKKLKIKSEIVFLHYILKILLRNASDYSEYKKELFNVQKKLNIIKKNHFWSYWRTYVNNMKVIQEKGRIILEKHKFKLLFKSYKTWNFFWFKIITNKMIIECINTKINANLKKNVFLYMVYVFNIRKSKFWQILSNLIMVRKLWSFQMIQKNMIFDRNQEIIENQLSNKIWLHIILKHWRRITLENKKICLLRNKLIVKRTLFDLIEFGKLIYLEEKFIHNSNRKLIQNIVKIWISQSRKKRNLRSIFNYMNLETIKLKIKLKIYLNKWYRKYQINRDVRYFIQHKNIEILRFYISKWFFSYNRIINNREKYQIILDSIKQKLYCKYFKLWVKNYEKRIQNRFKMNKLAEKISFKLINKVWSIMKLLSNRRIRNKFLINKSFIIIEKSILRNSWNLLKDIINLERSLEKVALEFQLFINKKRIIVIYNHWKYIVEYIHKRKLQELRSKQIYNYNLQKRCFNFWKINFDSEILKENTIQNLIDHKLRKNYCNFIRNLIRKWFNWTKKKKLWNLNLQLLLKSKLRTHLYSMIYLFNKYNSYKKGIIEYISYEFLNSFIFKIQYSRVISKNKQITITLDISVLIYNQYNITKRYMSKWLNSLYMKIQQKNIIKKESDKLYSLIKFIRKRIAFYQLINWNNWMIYKEDSITKNKILKFYKIIIEQLLKLVNERRFTIQISDLLYRNFMMKKISQGFQIWKIITQYHLECNKKTNIIQNKYYLNIISLVYYNWKSISKDYVKIYLLIKYIQKPFKNYALKRLKYNTNYLVIKEKKIGIFFQNWHDRMIYRKDLLSRSILFNQNYFNPRIKKLYFKLWRLLHQQKIRIRNFYDNIIIKKPLKQIFNSWYDEYTKRKIKEKLLVRKVQTRYKKLLLKSFIISYKILIKSKQNKKKLMEFAFNFWKILFKYERKRKVRLLKNIILNWRLYNIKQTNYRSNYNLIKENLNKRMKKFCYYRMQEIYRRKLELRKKENLVKDFVSRNYMRRFLYIWNNNTYIKIQRRDSLIYLINKNRNLTLLLYFKFWKRKFEKLQILRKKHQFFRQNRELKIIHFYLILWKDGWIPHRYLNASSIMIKLLNKIALHYSFHKLLALTFYCFNPKSNNDENLDLKKINENSKVYFSYKLECRCTERNLRIVLNEPRFHWIIESFMKISVLKKQLILQALIRFKKFTNMRIKYEKGFNNFEKCIKRIILTRVWFTYCNNSYKIFYIRKGLISMKDRINKNLKRKYLVQWIENYNNKIRYQEIIQIIRYKYEQTIQIKCFLIWSIKYYKNKRKRFLNLKTSKIKVIYLFSFTMKKFNEYSLYNKWLIWCKKAHDTIEWVHNFRIKSSLFLYWKKYSNKQKVIKNQVFAFYHKIILKIIKSKFEFWLNILRKVQELKIISNKFYLERILYKKYQQFFLYWKNNSLNIRKKRRKLLKFLDIKKKSLLTTCLKLWKFFVYYKKTRNERFTRITDIIKTNHQNLLIYRIFYSWKLKMIESLSLRSSIFLSLNNKINEDIKTNIRESETDSDLDLIKENSQKYHHINVQNLFSSDDTSSNSINDNENKVNLEVQTNEVQNLFSEGDLDVNELHSIQRKKNDRVNLSEISDLTLQPQINKNLVIHNITSDLPIHYITNNPYEPISPLSPEKSNEILDNSLSSISQHNDDNFFTNSKYLYSYSDSDSNHSSYSSLSSIL